MKKLTIMIALAVMAMLTACRGSAVDPIKPTSKPTSGTVSDAQTDDPKPGDTEVAATEAPIPEEEKVEFLSVTMKAQPAAIKRAAGDVSPEVLLYASNTQRDQIKVRFTLDGKQRSRYPDFTMLKVWLVDDNSSTKNDEKYGETFVSVMTKENQRNLPFVQGLGVMTATEETRGAATRDFVYEARLPFNIAPYDRVMITAETDTNRDEHNPRPGTPLWIGTINKNGKKVSEARLMPEQLLLIQDYDREGFEEAPLARELELPPLAFSRIEMSKNIGQVWLRLGFKEKLSLPEGAVLEGWLIDNFSNEEHNQKLGPAFNNRGLATRLKNSPQALTLGTLNFSKQDEQGYFMYETLFNPRTPLTSFDSINVTIESEKNTGEYDPRPGARLYYGKL